MKMKKPTLFRVAGFLKPQAAAIISTAVFVIINVAAALLAPYYSGRAVDLIVSPGNVNFTALPPVLLKLAVTVAVASLCSWAASVSANRAAYVTSEKLRQKALDKLTALPLSVLDAASSGDLASRVIADTDAVCDGLQQSLSQFLNGVCTIVGTMAFMLAVNVKLGLIVIVLTPLSVIVAALIAKACAKTFREQSRIRGELAAYTDEYIASHATVRVFGGGGRICRGFRETDEKLRAVGERAQFASSLTNPCTRFVNSLVYAAAGVFGALAIIGGGGMTVGGITAFLAYAGSYTKPFNEISSVIANLQSALSSAARVFELCDMADESDTGTKSLPSERTIRFENVSFSYSPDKSLIRNLNLSIPQGTRVAVVGPTGCGKTTLINLLMRFYDVTGGKITVGGVDIRDIPRQKLRSMYGMVLQDTWLCEGTLYDNIAYARPGASRKEVEAAASEAHADPFIRRLPDGYDTQTGSSSRLSGGERQLTAIARAVLADADVPILDEATSSVDTVTESRINSAFAKLLSGGKTSFTVAHRLSTIKNADLILVMKNGDIIESGSHSQLMDRGGFYRELYEYGLG